MENAPWYSIYWREITIAILGATSTILLTEKLRPVQQPLPLIEVREVVRTVEQQVEVVRYRDREVVKWRDRKVVVSKPDGTRIETTETSGSVAQQSDTSVSKERTVATEREFTLVERPQVKSNYRLGLSLDTQRDITLSGGARLGELPLFLQVSVSTNYQKPSIRGSSLGLGLTFEW